MDCVVAHVVNQSITVHKLTNKSIGAFTKSNVKNLRQTQRQVSWLDQFFSLSVLYSLCILIYFDWNFFYKFKTLTSREPLTSKHLLFLLFCYECQMPVVNCEWNWICFCFHWFVVQQSAETTDSTMTVETQQNHDRLQCKNAVPSTNNTNGMIKSNGPQKEEHFKRFADNTVQVCNVSLMENHLASRWVADLL